uniref:Proline rich Gla (G-carboxyglutamic acid) 4 (transmembrane) n=1 Tax=Maylandia zebra TaxID=106582 RepID=A0A3P9C280_9CICH|nr:transmembrane gamma-carboxyglutamic acid protein 4 [Maylandia zebra]
MSRDCQCAGALMAMLLHLFVLFQFFTCGDLAFVGQLPSENEESQNQVFVDEGHANSFLGRHLLFNRFDFEMFVPGNLERECIEEVCNYEEAREVFENIPDTERFWKEYTADKGGRSSRVDVVALLVGLIAGGVAIVIFGIVVWFLCQRRWKGNLSHESSIRVRQRRSNASLIMRRLEEVSLHPVPPSDDPPGLPSYEQAIARNGPHDAPPPPYPGSRTGSTRQ